MVHTQTLFPRKSQSWKGLQDPVELAGVSLYSAPSLELLFHHHFQRTKGDWETLGFGNLSGKCPLWSLKAKGNFRFLQVSKTLQFPKEGTLTASPEVLKQTSSACVLQAPWEEHSIGRLLLEALYLQMETRFEDMLGAGNPAAGSCFLTSGKEQSWTKHCFQGAHDYLQEQKSSKCAWEICRNVFFLVNSSQEASRTKMRDSGSSNQFDMSGQLLIYFWWLRVFSTLCINKIIVITVEDSYKLLYYWNTIWWSSFT